MKHVIREFSRENVSIYRSIISAILISTENHELCAPAYLSVWISRPDSRDSASLRRTPARISFGNSRLLWVGVARDLGAKLHGGWKPPSCTSRTQAVTRLRAGSRFHVAVSCPVPSIRASSGHRLREWWVLAFFDLYNNSHEVAAIRIISVSPIVASILLFIFTSQHWGLTSWN